MESEVAGTSTSRDRLQPTVTSSICSNKIAATVPNREKTTRRVTTMLIRLPKTKKEEALVREHSFRIIYSRWIRQSLACLSWSSARMIKCKKYMKNNSDRRMLRPGIETRKILGLATMQHSVWATQRKTNPKSFTSAVSGVRQENKRKRRLVSLSNKRTLAKNWWGWRAGWQRPSLVEIWSLVLRSSLRWAK